MTEPPSAVLAGIGVLPFSRPAAEPIPLVAETPVAFRTWLTVIHVPPSRRQGRSRTDLDGPSAAAGYIETPMLAADSAQAELGTRERERVRNRRLLGRQFPIEGGLARALRGDVSAEMSMLDEPENEYEREHWTRLLEVYAPVREDSGGRIIAVTEFYQLPNDLDAEIGAARLRSGGVVGAIALVTYLLLAGIVRRGSDTIGRQRTALAIGADPSGWDATQVLRIPGTRNVATAAARCTCGGKALAARGSS